MNEIVNDAAVKAIQDSVQTETIEVPVDQFTTRQVFAPPVEPLVATLEIHTLTGLVDFLASNIDSIEAPRFAIHVVSPDRVDVISSLRARPSRRDTLLSAKAQSLGFRFGNFYSCEDFVIALQSLFTESGDRGAILKLVGNIKEETVGQFNDDGVTQTVVARAGITRVEDVPVPNPVLLSPYRTFPDIQQPDSPFVLRMKRGGGDTPTCALFEADGGKWKLAAIESIAKYLRVKVAELKTPMDGIAIIA